MAKLLFCQPIEAISPHRIETMSKILILHYVTVIVDADGEKCITAGFTFGAASVTREYEIRVLQYDRMNKLGGPPGCLQFYVATTARVSTFNWKSNTRDDVDILTGKF